MDVSQEPNLGQNLIAVRTLECLILDLYGKSTIFGKPPHLSKYSKYQQIIPDTLVRFLKIAWHTSGSGDVPHSSTMTWRSSMFSWKMTLKIEKGRFGKLQNMFLNKQTTMYDDVSFFLSISEDTSPATRCN